MLPDPPVRDPGGVDLLTLSRLGRRGRLTATAAVLALLLGGTVWGNDGDFPFGPFRMYSTRADPDAPVISTRVIGRTADGEQVRLSGGEVGMRRAEFEGQLDRLVEDPRLLALVAESYAVHHPGADRLVVVQVVQRRYELSAGRRTGEVTDTVLVSHDVAAIP